MRAKTVAILAVIVFLLGGAAGALYAVLNSNTPSNDKLPVSSYSDLEDKDKDTQTDNKQDENKDSDKDNSTVNNDQQTNNANSDSNNANTDNKDNNASSVPTTENKVGEVNVREDSALSLRKGPGTDYERIGNVYRGDQLDILDEQNGWYKVKTYEGVEAWVSAQYIEIIE